VVIAEISFTDMSKQTQHGQSCYYETN